MAAEGVRVSVVFGRQPADYRASVLPSDVSARVAVEARIKLGRKHYVGLI